MHLSVQHSSESDPNSSQGHSKTKLWKKATLELSNCEAPLLSWELLNHIYIPAQVVNTSRLRLWTCGARRGLCWCGVCVTLIGPPRPVRPRVAPLARSAYADRSWHSERPKSLDFEGTIIFSTAILPLVHFFVNVLYL